MDSVDSEYVPFLLVTANVGSVFEDPSRLLKLWIDEFLGKITELKPAIIALHMQEVGGKTYEKSMEYVQRFIQILCESTELQTYNRIRIYLDEDYTSAEHFTALGNLYFIDESIISIRIWNFLTHDWDSVDGKSIHTGNIEAVATKEKAKFPQHFFPECKWSRKGFLRTRWEIYGTVVDLVNIHLFHDASNLAACEQFPSVYCKSRRRALVHTLERFHKDSVNGLAPYFVFGDFNFRCDTEGVIKKLTEDLTAHRKTDHTKVHYKNTDGLNVLTIGKKEFNHADHQKTFKESWLRQFDREMDPLTEILMEYPITFPPSYPYEEEPSMPQNYMSTRCPAWCDRIVMSPAGKSLIMDEEYSLMDYNIIGDNICMGDHKPVYLNTKLRMYQGIIRCCCSHVNSLNDYQHSLNAAYLRDSESTAIEVIACLYKCKALSDILAECLPFDRQMIDNNNIDNRISDEQTNDNEIDDTFAMNDETVIGTNLKIKPVVSINVIDSDNLNVCMCSLYASNDNVLRSNYNYCLSVEDGSICPQCRNIIKQQPTEHRKTLISKRLKLANNIIVNRVDTHYLSLNASSPYRKGFDPYTPESLESHSPIPESVNDSDGISNYTDRTLNELNDDDNVKPNDDHLLDDNSSNTPNIKRYSNTSTGGVSPRQLKSRLESLKRISTDSSNSIPVDGKDSHKSKGCCKRYCVIL